MVLEATSPHYRMAARPSFIDIRSQSHGPLGSSSPSLRPLTSPRLHVAGEVPPELSPLDAFAAQSRLLAKQLEKSVRGGRRISRLPPLTIEHSFHGQRAGYLQSASAEDLPESMTKEIQSTVRGLKAESDDPFSRPISVYPRLSRVQPRKSDFDASQSRDQDEQFRGRKPYGPIPDFGTRREASPDSIGCEVEYKRLESSPSHFAARPSVESIRQRGQPSQWVRDASVASRSYDTRALAPPRSPFAQKTSSVRSDSADGSEDDCSASLSTSFLSESRKVSASNVLSNPPASPFLQSIPRSPSVGSDISAGGSRLSRPTFNFSRPLSRASEPPPEIPSRQASSDSQPFVLADDTVHTPVSMYSEGFPENGNVSPGAPSYVYSRFSLPRGKILQRNSRIFQENQPTAEFRWEQPPLPYSNVQPYASGPMASPPSPPSRPSTSSLGQASSRSAFEPPDPFPLLPTDDTNYTQDEQNKHKGHGRPTSITGVSRPHTASMASGSTIKGPSQHSLAPSGDLSAEEHVTKGIDCHEQGSLKESTYHLRIAARQNHPTGMLLYALACRHGWGMRPNQREGVAWLRKAADSAFLEVADDENLLKAGGSVDILEQRTRKAQFALSIYELGVSHMNGWGIEQDKVLALRCFEIAGGLFP